MFKVFPLRSTGILLKSPVIIPRSCFSVALTCRAQSVIRTTANNVKSVITPIGKRSFASSGSSFSLPTRTFTFFTLSTLGIVGGFYVISYSLRQSNIYQASMDLINRCPEVIELVGTPVERKGLVKGKMSSGVADMHFLVKGPKGQVIVTVGGTLREGSKTEYDLQSIKISNRSKKDETSIVLYDNYQPQLEFLPREATPVSSNTSATATTEGTEEKPVKYGFLLDKPWYYRIGLAVLTGAAMGVILSFMIMGARQAPKNSSAYQSLLVLLKENKTASEILGDGIKSAGKMMGKSEENWANFSIRMSGKKSTATVNCQAFRQGDNWRFTVVSLDTASGRVYLCK